jgi:hypothetical protein
VTTDTQLAPTHASFWFGFRPVEVVKSASADEGKKLLGKVRGIATLEVPDKVAGDIIDFDTLQLKYLCKGGVFTYEHPRNVLNTVGFPSSAKIIEDYLTPEGKRVRALEVEGFMYLNDELGAAIYYKACTMQEAGGDRQFGWSLEGPGLVNKADVSKPTRRVRYHEPKSIAICLEPAVEYALWDVAASATTGANEVVDVMAAAREFVAEIAKSAREVDEPRSDVRDGDDKHVVTLLKSFPTLTWVQGQRWIEKIRSTVDHVMGQHKE